MKTVYKCWSCLTWWISSREPKRCPYCSALHQDKAEDGWFIDCGPDQHDNIEFYGLEEFVNIKKRKNHDD